MARQVYGLSGLIKGGGFRFLILLLALLLFSWPYLRSGRYTEADQMMIFLFISWTFLILVQFITAIILYFSPSRESGDIEESESDV